MGSKSLRTPSPQTKNYTSLYSLEPVLTKLQFSLHDRYTRELVLFSQGTSTYITLGVGEVESKMNQELITLISNDKQALKTRPENNNTDFTITLPQHLTLQGFNSWCLKLLAFNFTAELRNIESTYSYFDIFPIRANSPATLLHHHPRR